MIHEPWCATAQVAEIYAFKLNYDRKASKLGLPPIPLGEAVSAVNYTRYGVVEVGNVCLIFFVTHVVVFVYNLSCLLSAYLFLSPS